MRFDLEIEVVDKLTQAGKDKIASLFFSSTQSSEAAVFNNILIPYIPEIDLERYKLVTSFNSLKSIAPSNFRSRVENTGTLLFSRLLIKQGSLIPFFSRGNIYFNRYPILFSNDSLRMLVKYDEIFNEYFSDIPDTLELDTLRVWTSCLAEDGTIDTDAEYSFINTDNVTVEILDTPYTPTSYKPNTIFVTTTNGIANEVYRVTKYGQLIKVFGLLNVIDASLEELYRLTENGTALIDKARKRVIVKNNNKIYDYRRKILFSNSTLNYLYTIEPDIITNKKRLYINTKKNTFTQNISEQNIESGKSRILFFEKYPLTNIETTIINQNISIKAYNSFIKITNNSATSINLNEELTGELNPLISYSRGMVDQSKDIKHIKVDISPKSINFGDGTLCFSNAEISKSSIPSIIDISFPDGNIISPFGSIRVKVKVLNIDGAVIPNAQITLNLLDTLGGMVQWGGLSTSSTVITGMTNLSGELIVTLINTDIKLGTYVQKEWVGDVTRSGNNFTVSNKNIVYLPYDIKTTNTENIYLFIITGDDPVLSQIKDNGGAYGITAEKFTSPTPYDYYETNKDITSYSISGRKIAYVELVSDKVSDSSSDYTVTSKHIKPIEIEIINTPKDFFLRKLFLYNLNISLYGKDSEVFPTILTDTSSANFQYIQASDFTITSIQSSGFNYNWELINNTFSYCKVTIPVYTKITYLNNLPGVDDQNVLGYYAKIKTDNNNISFSASYYDPYLDISIIKQDDSVIINGLNIDESSFKLSTDIGNMNSYLGAYSYLTLSEYINAPYGSNFTTYVCKYSGRVVNQISSNRCTYPDSDIANTYYEPSDSSNLYCKHSVEYDSSIPSINRCPMLDAKLINPFIFYS